MALALGIQLVVVTVLFGAIYLVIVTWFALAAREIAARRRRRRGASTWIVKQDATRDARFFDRMG